MLCQAHREGRSLELLKTRRIAVLTSEPVDPASLQVMQGLRRLGADVVDLAAGLAPGAPDSDVRATAHLLGQLYDAVDCESEDPSIAEALRAHSPVPVFHRLGGAPASDDHARPSPSPESRAPECALAFTLAYVVDRMSAASH